MPKKSLDTFTLSVQVEARLQEWGLCIRNSRIRQHLRVQDVCERMGIAHTTLRRIERGDPGAGVGLYLTLFHLLGALEQAAPLLPAALLEGSSHHRVRLSTRTIDDEF